MANFLRRREASSEIRHLSGTHSSCDGDLAIRTVTEDLVYRSMNIYEA